MKFYTTNKTDYFVYAEELEERNGKYYRLGLPVNAEKTIVYRNPMKAAESVLKRLHRIVDKSKGQNEYNKFIFSFAGLFETVDEFFDPSFAFTGIINDICRIKLGMEKEYEFVDLFPSEESLSVKQLEKIGLACESIESTLLQKVIYVNAFGKTAVYREDDCNPGDFWFESYFYPNNLYGAHKK